MLLGCPVEAYRELDAFREALCAAIVEGGAHSVAINAEKVMRAKQDEGLREALRTARILIPDGVGASWGLLLVEGVRCVRADGPREALALADRNGWRVFLAGGKPGVAAEAWEAVAEEFPGIVGAGHMDGYQSEEVIKNAMLKSDAHLVLLGLGSPKQELFAARMTREAESVPHKRPFIMGCGGALDILAGQAIRAPKVVQELGMEWAYRLVRQPSRIRRQAVLPKFAAHVLWATAERRLRSERSGTDQ